MFDRGQTVKAAAQTRMFGVSVGEVSAIDDWVEQAAAQLGASEQAAFGARLCVAELAANVLEHGRSHSDNDHIIITIGRLGDRIGVEFLDSRGAFDPTVEFFGSEPDPASLGGHGLLLLRAYADDLSYANDGAYNRLKFKVKSANGSSTAGPDGVVVSARQRELPPDHHRESSTVEISFGLARRLHRVEQ